ncbi:MAG: 6-bladed beta-propeller [Bacteroidota bacterium]
MSKIFLRTVILGGFLFFGFNIVFSQDTIKNEKHTYVRWVSQFPSVKKEKQEFSKRISKVIFGKEPLFLKKPFNVIAKNPNDFWILDQGRGGIVHIKKSSAEIPRFILKELEGFTSLVGVSSIDDGKILITDSHLDNVYLIDLLKKKIIPLNEALILKRPTGIAYSKITDEIWVVETGSHSICVLNREGEILKRIGQRGKGPGEFNFPTFIWIDKLGNAYIVDSMNFRIQIFNKQGEFVTTFGQIGDASGYFSRPKGIATDSFGNIYVADALFHVVQIFDKSGRFLYRFGQQGNGKSEFWMPTGIFIDEKNYIYVADSYNSRVQVFQLVTSEKGEK